MRTNKRAIIIIITILVGSSEERDYKRDTFAQNFLYSLNEYYRSLHPLNQTEKSSSRGKRFNDIHSQDGDLDKRTNNRHDIAFPDDRKENC